MVTLNSASTNTRIFIVSIKLDVVVCISMSFVEAYKDYGSVFLADMKASLQVAICFGSIHSVLFYFHLFSGF